MIKHIRYKSKGVRLFQQGYFGNCLAQWDCVSDAFASEHPGPFVLRQRSGGGGFCQYGIKRDELFNVERHVIDDLGICWTELYINEEIPGPSVILNCEIFRSWRGLHLFYSRQPMNMRTALAHDGQVVVGLNALEILRECCCERGYDAVMEFLDRFPEHVLEVTCFSSPFGTLGWRTIIWEVRDY